MHAGGYNSSGGPIRQNEIFNPLLPAANSWLSQNPLNQARAEFALVVVPDGRAMAVGGVSTGGVTATAEAFSPTTNFWEPTGSMAQPRADFEAIAIF